MQDPVLKFVPQPVEKQAKLIKVLPYDDKSLALSVRRRHDGSFESTQCY